jgi:hypothetical protein
LIKFKRRTEIQKKKRDPAAAEGLSFFVLRLPVLSRQEGVYDKSDQDYSYGQSSKAKDSYDL